MGTCVRQTLLDGIAFNQIADKRFKSNRMSIYLIVPLQEKTTAANAMVASLLRKGNEHFPDFVAFNRYLNELYGAYVDCGVQKRGDEQIVYLSMGALDDRYTLEGEALTKEVCNLLCDLLFAPILKDGLFLEEEIRIEKETLIDAIRAEINDKRTYALNRANRLLCKGEPAGLSRLGTVEDVQNLTAKTVTDAYHNLLATAHIELFFTGSGDGQIFADCFKQKLDQSLRTQTIPRSGAFHQRSDTVLEEVEHIEVEQSKMVLGFSTGEINTPEEFAAMQLMVAILGGTPMSKLFVNVREKLSLCYYCAARFDAVKGLLKIDSGVENPNIEQAKAEILRQLEEMKQGNFTQKEIDEARMSLENSYRTTYDSVGGLEGYYLGQVLQGTLLSPEEKANLLSAVTAEQLVQAANLVTLELTYLLKGKED